MKDKYSFFQVKRRLLFCIEDERKHQLPDPGMIPSSFDTGSQTAILTVEVSGTQYEGRSQRLENYARGNKVNLTREPSNPYDSNAIAVTAPNGDSLGNLPSCISNSLAPLLDVGFASIGDARISYLLPLSQRGGRAKKAVLYITFDIKLDMPAYPSDSCVVCFLGGDHIRCWVQSLEVLHCRMTPEEAMLIFEIYNRLHDEYNPAQNDTFYCGLENLDDEVSAARKKMRQEMKPGLDYGPTYSDEDEIEDYGFENEWTLFYRFAMSRIKAEPERYGRIEKYIHNSFYACGEDWIFQEIFRPLAFEEETCYWKDYARVSEKEFYDYSGGYNHWYDVAELFGTEFPIDLSDPEVVTIFGTGKFLALADLSYGC